MGGLNRDRATKPVPQDQILRRKPGQGKYNFSRSDDYEQDRQPYPVYPSSTGIAHQAYITNLNSLDKGLS